MARGCRCLPTTSFVPWRTRPESVALSLNQGTPLPQVSFHMLHNHKWNNDMAMTASYVHVLVFLLYLCLARSVHRHRHTWRHVAFSLCAASTFVPLQRYGGIAWTPLLWERSHSYWLLRVIFQVRRINRILGEIKFLVVERHEHKTIIDARNNFVPIWVSWFRPRLDFWNGILFIGFSYFNLPHNHSYRCSSFQ